MADRIRILLLDDNPESLVVSENGITVPMMPRELERYFEPLWLATSEEAREFRVGLLAVASVSPELLGAKNVIPEILIFDYDLLKDKTRVKDRATVGKVGYEKISPLPRLSEAMREAQITLESLKGETTCPRVERRSFVSTPEQGAAAKATDNSGCFAGGLLLAGLSDHPCAGIPSTRWGSDKTKGSEAAIFEWLLERDSDRSFEEKGRQWPNWEELIRYAVPRLRKRISELDNANLITLSMQDLFTLSTSGSLKGTEVLRVWSRYGLRHLPLTALFIDHAEMDRSREVKAWAIERLEALLERSVPGAQLTQAKEDLMQGQRIAGQLWQLYTSEIRLRRERLADLVKQQETNSLSKEEQQELDKAVAEFALTFDSDGVAECAEHVCTIQSLGKGASGRSVRWAVLFIGVHLYDIKCRALTNYDKYVEATGFTFPRPFKDLEPGDVLLALYPVPSKYPKGNPADDWGKYLVRLKDSALPELPSTLTSKGKTPDKKGNLGIGLSSVLAGESFQTLEEVPPDKWTFGLIPGEQHILRRYALDMGLSKSDGSGFMKAILNTPREHQS